MKLIDEYVNNLEECKKKYGENVFLLYRTRDYYEAFGLIIGPLYTYLACFSNTCGGLDILKTGMYIEGKEVLMSGFNHTDLEDNVQKLNNNGYTVVVYKQGDDANKRVEDCAFITTV